MNYKPVVTWNQSNGSAGKARVETVLDKDNILLPLWTQDLLLFSSSKDSPGDGFKPSWEEEKKDAKNPENKDNEVLSTEEPIVSQEKDLNVNNTKNINTVSLTSNAARIKDNAVDKDIVYGSRSDIGGLSYGKRAIGTKWIYKNKKDEKGIVVRNMERLVTQGYTQEEGIDYDEVFAPVARIEAIKLFLAYASFKDFVIEEEVYVCKPLRFEDPEFPNIVYKVEKALYGLHQALRACTPMEPSKPLLKDENVKDVDVHLYRSMIRSLMYLTSLRPDIMFAQFWATAKVNTVNGEEHIQALVDNKKVIIIETSVRSDLQLEDDEEVVADDAVYEAIYVSVERVATTATGVDAEQDRGIISKIQFTETLNETSSIRNSSGSGPRRQETIRDAAAQTRIIDNLDADEGVTLVDETQGRNDQDMFNTYVLDDGEVVAEKEVSTAYPVTTTGEVVTTAGVEVSTAATTPIIFMDDITLAKALASLKSEKPMVKESSVPVSAASNSPKLKNKSFEEVQKAFDNTMSWINSFVPIDKEDMYDSWKSRMELYMLNRQHGRMILESVKNDPLLWPTVEEDGVTRLKKYSELSAAEAIQANCDSYHQHQFQPQASTYQSSPYTTQYHPPQYASQAPSSSNLSISYPPNDIQSSINHNVYMASSSIPQMEYAPTVHQQSKFSSPKTRLVFLFF
nr:copia protein [Tanacetum cinerariifolium]